MKKSYISLVFVLVIILWGVFSLSIYGVKVNPGSQALINIKGLIPERITGSVISNNPFHTFKIAENTVSLPVQNGGHTTQNYSLASPSMSLSAIIWDESNPQAIIKDISDSGQGETHLVREGESIKYVQILTINQNFIIIDEKGTVFQLYQGYYRKQ